MRSPVSHAFSLIEIALALAVAAMIASLAVTYYEEHYSQGLLSATRQELDTIRRAIEIWEAREGRSWQRTYPPLDTLSQCLKNSRSRIPLDRWGNPFRVDPKMHIVYSLGADGTDQKGSGDDISLTYEASDVSHLHPPYDLRATRGGPPVILEWKAPAGAPPPAGYTVERRAAGEVEWTKVGDIVPGDTTSYRDASPPVSKTPIYYRVRCIIDKTGATGPPSKQAGWAGSRSASVPELTVAPLNIKVKPGETVVFHIRAISHGAELDKLLFNTRNLSLDGNSAAFTLNEVFNTDKTFKAVLSDKSGQRTFTTVHVTVSP